MSNVDFADYKFTVKEGQPSRAGAEAPTWLMCEPMTSELSIVGDKGFLSLRLPEGTTVDQAHEIARYIQMYITRIQYTRLP
ncbi:MAG: hypothetical protein ACJ8G1_13485 [Vitreoscilla sp.]